VEHVYRNADQDGICTERSGEPLVHR
jgi:hypothetical protein